MLALPITIVAHRCTWRRRKDVAVWWIGYCRTEQMSMHAIDLVRLHYRLRCGVDILVWWLHSHRKVRSLNPLPPLPLQSQAVCVVSISLCRSVCMMYLLLASFRSLTLGLCIETGDSKSKSSLI